MIVPKCTRSGCNWKGNEKATEGAASQAVKMHIARVHDRTIRVPKQGTRKKRHLALAGNGHGHPAALSDTDAVVKVDRRSREWRLAHPRLAKRIGIPTGSHNGHKHHKHGGRPAKGIFIGGGEKINNCWNCGASQKHLSEGLVLAKLMESDPTVRAKVQAMIAHI